MSMQFLMKFFELTLPAPGVRYQAGVDAKSDLKLLLEIATNSRLKQGQDKKNQNKQIFYCRSLGKDCFKIQVQFSEDGYFQVLDDYTQISHKCGCQKSGEDPMVIKIYNLMMLKRALIQQFMNYNQMVDSSPETILQRISGDKGQYFYCDLVSDLESRRKLKKRFDNIVNISIKKKRQSKPEQAQPISSRNEQGVKKRRGRKYCQKTMQNKQNQNYTPQIKISLKNFQQPSYKYDQSQYSRPRKRVKMNSNSSIYLNKPEQQQVRVNNPSLIFAGKGDSIFQQQQSDYFKKNSDIHIALNMLNQAGSHNYWPQSDNSIGEAVNSNMNGNGNGNGGDRLIDDIFTSIRNSLLRSLERKSLNQIDCNFGININGEFGGSDHKIA